MNVIEARTGAKMVLIFGVKGPANQDSCAPGKTVSVRESQRKCRIIWEVWKSKELHIGG